MAETTHQTKYHMLLSDLGLNYNESLVYDYLLRKGGQPATVISRNTGLSRPNTYNVLEKLKQMELITATEGSGKTHFEPEHPKTLYEQLRREEARVDTAREQLDDVVNEMISDYSLGGQRPGVLRFEGAEAVQRAYREMLNDRLPISSIMNRAAIRKVGGEFNDYWVEKRKEYGITHRIITPKSGVLDTNDFQENRSVRYLDEKDFPFHMDIKLNKKRLILTTFKEETGVGVVIMDADITQNFEILFNFLWRVAKVPARN